MSTCDEEWKAKMNQAGTRLIDAWRNQAMGGLSEPAKPITAEERIKHVVNEINNLDKLVEKLNAELRLLRTPDGAAMWNLMKGAKP